MTKEEMLDKLKVVSADELVMQKWIDILQGAGVDDGASNCAYCEIYKCAECPIARMTGQEGCQGSPYATWVDHQYSKHTLSWSCRGGYIVRCSQCKAIVKEWIEFLKRID